MNIGEKIVMLRRNAGMSQDDLAEALNVSRQSVSKWESGKALPDSDKILALSEIFGVTTDSLLKESESLIETFEEVDVTDEPEEDNEVSVEKPVFALSDEDTADMPKIEFEEEKTETKKPAGKRKLSAKKIICVAVAVCVLISAIAVPCALGCFDPIIKKLNGTLSSAFEEPIEYPYILVHGLGGWGAESRINETLPYWGNSAGDIAKLMTEQGKETYDASVGPFSSTWDRTCELYAQLTGTTVDYGEAHSAAHGHERYGRIYTAPLFEGWGSKTKFGQVKKINLVGHSFGGETVRLLASLMAYGDESECNASGENVSPLFKGGKGDWINSVTTLCSPHNGSTLFYIVDQYKLVELILNVVYAAGGISSTTPLKNLYDFRLEHFGITDTSDAAAVINKVFSEGIDNAAYDLSPDGAAELNKMIKVVDGVYYFSYSYSTTQPGKLLAGHQIPVLKTNPILMAPAEMMGRYSENKVTDFPIDESWLENDGLVNVVSARYPMNDAWQEFDSDNIVIGKWNVMPTRSGDHGTVIGLLADNEKTKSFYKELYKMIDDLPRS